MPFEREESAASAFPSWGRHNSIFSAFRRTTVPAPGSRSAGGSPSAITRIGWRARRAGGGGWTTAAISALENRSGCTTFGSDVAPTLRRRWPGNFLTFHGAHVRLHTAVMLSLIFAASVVTASASDLVGLVNEFDHLTIEAASTSISNVVLNSGRLKLQMAQGSVAIVKA